MRARCYNGAGQGGESDFAHPSGPNSSLVGEEHVGHGREVVRRGRPEVVSGEEIMPERLASSIPRSGWDRRHDYHEGSEARVA
jgi:hypothetical protein